MTDPDSQSPVMMDPDQFDRMLTIVERALTNLGDQVNTLSRERDGLRTEVAALTEALNGSETERLTSLQRLAKVCDERDEARVDAVWWEREQSKAAVRASTTHYIVDKAIAYITSGGRQTWRDLAIAVEQYQHSVR